MKKPPKIELNKAETQLFSALLENATNLLHTESDLFWILLILDEFRKKHLKKLHFTESSTQKFTLNRAETFAVHYVLKIVDLTQIPVEFVRKIMRQIDPYVSQQVNSLKINQQQYKHTLR